ncbi:hypothetical protein BB561_005160 [Smittium simulii]|uniref:Uncharacterized protein n=1 Tax=Smittium simulii TaxID=133385 RepID=A0A2T9YBS3_9FUNG|nr:hypothetical protein BB561_005160 [Smittium simulii]
MEHTGQHGAMQTLRANILAQYINIYMAQVATKPPLLPASISMRLVGKLLGEELKLSSTIIRKDPTVLCDKTTLAKQKCNNQHKRVRAPMVEVESYPRLIETITLLETNFFGSPIPEEKKKIIYECSKFLRIKYTLPSLNEAATPAFEKTMIQDYEDLEFAHLIRDLLFDVASGITQSRASILHKSTGLLSRASQLKVASKEQKKQEKSLLSAQVDCVCTTSSTAHTFQNATPNSFKNNQNKEEKQELSVEPQMSSPVGERLATNLNPEKPKASARKKFISFRGISAKQLIPEKLNVFYEEKIGVIGYGPPLTLYPHRYKRKMNKKANNAITKESTLYNTKENRRPTSSSRSPETRRLCRGEKFQNGIPDIHIPRGRFYAHSDTPEVQEIYLFSMGREDFQFCVLPFELSLSPHTFTKVLRPSIGIFGRPFNNRQVQKKMYEEYREIILQTKPTGVQDQDGEVQYDTISIDYSSGDNNNLTNYEFKSPIRQGTSNLSCSSPWLPNAEKTFGIKKKNFKDTEIIDCHAIQNLEFWKQSLCKLNGLLFLPVTPEMGILTDFSNTACVMFRVSNGIRVKKRERKKKHDSAWGIVFRCWSHSGLWPLSIVSAYINIKKLLTVHYALHLHSVFGCSVLVYSDNTTTLAYVQKFEGITSPKLLEVPESCGLITGSSNGIISINRDIQETEQNIWPIQRGSLVPGQSISRNQRTEPLLVAMEQPLIFSPVESNTTDPTEDSTGKDNYDNNYANVEVCDLVSNSGKNKNSRAHTNTGVIDYARSKKWQISSTHEQILVAVGMENQRRTFQQKGLTYLALDLITANTRFVKKRLDTMLHRRNL